MNFYNLRPVNHTHCNDCEDLFMLASRKGWNSANFVKCWMNSDECESFEQFMSKYHTCGAPYILDILYEKYQDELEEPGEVVPEVFMDWIGGMYRYWVIKEGISSKELYKICDLEVMKKAVLWGLNEDPDTAIELIKERYLK